MECHKGFVAIAQVVVFWVKEQICPWFFLGFAGPDAPDVEIPEFSPRDKGRGWVRGYCWIGYLP